MVASTVVGCSRDGGSGSAATGSAAIDGALPCRGETSDHPACPDPRVVDALDAVWSDRAPSWEAPTIVVAARDADGTCARAGIPSAAWYCPPPRAIVLHPDHPGFVERHVREHGGEHAEAYVVAREHGHHLQQLRGLLDPPGGGIGGDPQERARIELQADCLAGVGLHHAVGDGHIDPFGVDDLEAAVRTVGAVDARIRAEAPALGQPFPGPSTQERVAAARLGWEAADEGACDEVRADPTAGTVLPPPSTVGSVPR